MKVVKHGCRVFGVTACVFISACNVLSEKVCYPPAKPIDIPPPPKVNGTIYQPGYEKRLYHDKVAHQIGDILTVRLEEQKRGQYRSITRTQKVAGLNYPIPVFFGSRVGDMQVQADSEQRFDARGDSDQQSRLTGTVSVTVIELLANGNMVVQGESWVTINQGRELMRLKGIVRPEDIEPNNVISSQRIASASIISDASGQAGYANKGGIITRLFNRFFPY